MPKVPCCSPCYHVRPCASPRSAVLHCNVTPPLANRSERPVRMAFRDARRRLSNGSKGPIRVSWACLFSKQLHSCAWRASTSKPSMNEEILINVTPQETRVALILQGAVQELHVERTLSRGRVGNVYLGKVVRVLPGMQSAFIDIGLERAAFLHVADIWHPRIAGETHSNAPHIPIEKIVFEGQALMVQVVKDPIGTKGARLSTQVSIAGRTLVYLPQEPHIGISQKIASEAEREAIRARLTAVLPVDEKGGYIVR